MLQCFDRHLLCFCMDVVLAGHFHAAKGGPEVCILCNLELVPVCQGQGGGPYRGTVVEEGFACRLERCQEGFLFLPPGTSRQCLQEVVPVQDFVLQVGGVGFEGQEGVQDDAQDLWVVLGGDFDAIYVDGELNCKFVREGGEKGGGGFWGRQLKVSGFKPRKNREIGRQKRDSIFYIKIKFVFSRISGIQPNLYPVPP